MTHRIPNAVSRTEIGHLDGVTSNIQTQLNGKMPATTEANTDAAAPNGSLFYDLDYASADVAMTQTQADARYGPIAGAPPIGTVMPYAGATVASPWSSNWLLCYGQAVSRTTYATLFSILSTTYGVGDGSTTFNLPDLRGRVAAGVDNMGGSDAGRIDWANTLGTASGEQYHTLSTAEIPAHNHTLVSNATNTYGQAWMTTDGSNIQSGTGQPKIKEGYTTISNTGGGGAHNTMQPTILLNYIIRVV